MVCQAGVVAWRAVELLRLQPGMWEAVAGCLPEAAQRSLLLGAPDLDDGDEEPPEVTRSIFFPSASICSPSETNIQGCLGTQPLYSPFGQDNVVNVSKSLCDVWMYCWVLTLTTRGRRVISPTWLEEV